MKKYRPSIFSVLVGAILISALSCKKKDNYQPYISYTDPNNPNWTYTGAGDGNVGTSNNVTITFPIESNLNVNGKANLSTNAVVKNDLNLNESGKVTVNTHLITDTVFLNGNVNLNDSLLIFRGIVKVARDFNINSKGFVSCGDSAQIIIGGSLGQSGILWGNKRVFAKVKNINNPDKTFDSTYYWHKPF